MKEKAFRPITVEESPYPSKFSIYVVIKEVKLLITLPSRRNRVVRTTRLLSTTHNGSSGQLRQDGCLSEKGSRRPRPTIGKLKPSLRKRRIEMKLLLLPTRPYTIGFVAVLPPMVTTIKKRNRFNCSLDRTGGGSADSIQSIAFTRVGVGRCAQSHPCPEPAGNGSTYLAYGPAAELTLVLLFFLTSELNAEPPVTHSTTSSCPYSNASLLPSTTAVDTSPALDPSRSSPEAPPPSSSMFRMQSISPTPLLLIPKLPFTLWRKRLDAKIPGNMLLPASSSSTFGGLSPIEELSTGDSDERMLAENAPAPLLRSCTISPYKCFKQIRALFPEFEGRQINVKVHKGWGRICRYIPKMEKKKVVWGEYSLKQILEIGDASAKDQAIPYKPEKTGGAVVIEKVMKYDEWYDALEDPALKDTLIRSYSNLRGLFEDLKVAKDRQSNAKAPTDIQLDPEAFHPVVMPASNL
ncbi:unnamed protein product, partial [Dovyalis caffra]